MSTIKNSNLMVQVLALLIQITARRSSDTIACAFIEAIIKTLQEKYYFLKCISIKNVTYYEGSIANAIRIKSDFNFVKPELVGEAIEAIVRILCMDLEEETGLFFIKEFKDKLTESSLYELKIRGVDLDLLNLEQKHLHEQLEKRKALVHHESDENPAELQTHILNYTWDAVASFKYRNNMCFLYDKTGKLLDKLPLNKIIEYYIRTLTDFGRLVERPDEIVINDAEVEFLKMIYNRDMDEESARFFLRLTQAEFGHMLQRLLRAEMLQYVSEDEIKLTEKGVAFIEEKLKQTQNKTSGLPLENTEPVVTQTTAS